jgi:hypothetical protein
MGTCVKKKFLDGNPYGDGMGCWTWLLYMRVGPDYSIAKDC